MAPVEFKSDSWAVKSNIYYNNSHRIMTDTCTHDNIYSYSKWVWEDTNCTDASCLYLGTKYTDFYASTATTTDICVGVGGIVVGGALGSYGYHVFSGETEEQRKAREKHERKERERLARANKKGEKLLLELIGSREFKKYKRRGYLEVPGPTGVIYRLRPGHMMDVMARDMSKVDHKLCVILKDHKMPPIDLLISEYLLLTSGQEGLLLDVGIKHGAGGLSIGNDQITNVRWSEAEVA